MVLYLALQNTYQAVEIALFQDEEIIDQVILYKTEASKQLIRALDELLKRHNQNFSSISFLAVNQGPGPFTTLRVVISTVNGIAFATKKPLVGIDGLEGLLAEYENDQNTMVLALLNAFHHDVYYAFKMQTQIEKGYDNIEHLLAKLQSRTQQKMLVIGNGGALYQSKLSHVFGDQVEINSAHETVSLQQIARLGLQQWHKGIHSPQLMPLYLKRAFYTL